MAYAFLGTRLRTYDAAGSRAPAAGGTGCALGLGMANETVISGIRAEIFRRVCGYPGERHHVSELRACFHNANAHEVQAAVDELVRDGRLAKRAGGFYEVLS